jgi:hypothetical protein
MDVFVEAFHSTCDALSFLSSSLLLEFEIITNFNLSLDFFCKEGGGSGIFNGNQICNGLMCAYKYDVFLCLSSSLAIICSL